MSKLSASKKFMPAGWVGFCSIIAIAACAALGIAGSTSLRAHRGSISTQAVAAAPKAPALGAEQRGRVQASMGKLPLAFEANQGQTDPQVKYMARGNGYTVFLTANETVFAMSSQTSPSRPSFKHGLSAGSRTVATTKQAPAAIYMKPVGGNSHPQVAAGSELPGRTNYFIGSDPSKWQQGVKQYANVSYRDVYPGVDMAFHGQQRQLEFDFIVAPGASPGRIAMGFTGAKKLSVDASGNLLLASAAGDVVLHKPVAYQERDGRRELVEASFDVKNNREAAFSLGVYDHRRELVIDPSLSYATYLGGTAEDDGYAIAVDGSGNTYVTGQTASTNFPTVAGAFKTSFGGSFDAFVTKISSDGSKLLYSTYVGGTGDDSGNAIAVDASGDAFVAGGTSSSSNFPTTAGAFQTVYGGGSLDGFVFELAPSGGSLTYSTYLGGSDTDFSAGIAVDSSGNTYVAGSTYSTDFPTQGPIQGSIKGVSNGFVGKLNASGSALVYSTYLGGGTGDFASAIAVDSSNNAYVTGATQNSAFPTTAGAFQTTCGTAANCNGGLSDAFVSVINAAGSGFVYSTFLGGGEADQGLAIAVDSAGNAYVTGLTQSSGTFPTKNALQGTYGGGTQDAFVSALNPAGSALIYSTYLGGSQADAAAGIAVDGSKNAYVTGQTGSSNFPVSSATQGTSGGGNDAFVTEISPAGSLLFSTYLGGSLNEDSTSGGANVSPIGGITVDSAGADIYLTGNTASTDFPAVASEQGANAGGTDAFVAKYTQTGTGSTFTVANGALSSTSGSSGVSGTSTITVSSVNNFSSTVTLACAVTPVVTDEPACSFSGPGSLVSVSVGGNATTTLTVSTTAASAMLARPSSGRPSHVLYAMILPVFGITLLSTGMSSNRSRRKKLFGFLILGLLLTGLLLMPACSSSNGGGGGGNTGTPAGTYTITVTGSGGGATATGSPALTLTVN